MMKAEGRKGMWRGEWEGGKYEEGEEKEGPPVLIREG